MCEERYQYPIVSALGEGDQSTEISFGPEILDAFPFYIMLVDADHRILLANKATRQSLGIDPQQIVGAYCPMVVHGLDRPFPGCPLEEAVEKRHAVERQLFDPTSGRWLNSAIYPIGCRTQSGREIFLHMVQDITEGKEAEEGLRRNYDIQTVTNSLLHLSLEEIPLDKILKHAVDLVLSIPWLALESRGSIFLVEDDPKTLVMKAQNGLPESLQQTCARMPFGRCLCGRAALMREGNCSAW